MQILRAHVDLPAMKGYDIHALVGWLQALGFD
jgi:hypothetical protein